MTISQGDLVDRYASAMHEGDAALFVGAGLSSASGFVDWKGLLKRCCEEIGLDVEREHDLVAVAQYYLNENLLDRSRLNQTIVEEFARAGELSENHRMIAGLPVRTVWTTNFDALLETAYREAGRICDAKSADRSIATQKPNRDVVLYKMHGDVARPEETVICRDDYEQYAKKHPVFQNLLQGHLTSKTFLFLGFGFSDPNLDYMLGHIRSLLGESKREHYAVMREAQRGDYPSTPTGKAQYDYDKRKQGLRLKDLERYSIKTAVIRDYGEVTGLLHAVARRSKQRNVFVSGSAHDFTAFGETRLRNLCAELGRILMEQEYNLVTGFGRTVGSAVIIGALSKLYEAKRPAVERRLLLRPFPQKQVSGTKGEEFSRRHREEMIASCGFAVFIAGNRPGHRESPGVLEEFAIALQTGCTPIPIGATGSAALRIWNDLSPNLRQVYGRSVHAELFRKLNRPQATDEELLRAVFEIMRQSQAI